MLSVSLRMSWTTGTFKSLDWVKQTALPNVSGPHSITWRPAKNKNNTEFPWIRRNSFCPTAFKLQQWFFFPLPLTQTETSALPGSPAPWPLDWEPHYQLSWASVSPDCRSWDLLASRGRVSLWLPAQMTMWMVTIHSSKSTADGADFRGRERH